MRISITPYIYTSKIIIGTTGAIPYKVFQQIFYRYKIINHHFYMIT